VLAILPGSRKLDFGASRPVRGAQVRLRLARHGAGADRLRHGLGAAVSPQSRPRHRGRRGSAENDTLFFNAGRLDRSMELDTKDWLAVAKPRVAKIAAVSERGASARSARPTSNRCSALRIDVMREHLERVFRYKPSRARRIFRGTSTSRG
jgi:hypothetical protein